MSKSVYIIMRACSTCHTTDAVKAFATESSAEKGLEKIIKKAMEQGEQTCYDDNFEYVGEDTRYWVEKVGFEWW